MHTSISDATSMPRDWNWSLVDKTIMTGIFTGSFDPFTIGHDDIVRRALPLFDRIVIGIGVNERKK